MSRINCVRSITRRLTISFDIALLRGTEVVIEEKNVGVHRRGRARNFFKLPAPINVAGIRTIPPLHQFAHNLRARAVREGAQFGERFIGVKLRNDLIAAA